MKKNFMMRAASALLVAVLLSTCTISGTFAKYVTEGSASDSARVAKFGVVVTGTTGAANQAFAMEYGTDDAIYGGAVTVAASENLVAPGTSGTFSDFVITGIPEVATRVTYTANFNIGDQWKVSSTINNVEDTGYEVSRNVFYCPIIIKIKGDGVNQLIHGLNFDKKENFEDAVENAIKAVTNDYAPNVAPSDANLTIEWEWAFDKNSSNAHSLNNDVYDTQLGDLAAKVNPVTISLEVTCIVTQID